MQFPFSTLRWCHSFSAGFPSLFPPPPLLGSPLAAGTPRRSILSASLSEGEETCRRELQALTRNQELLSGLREQEVWPLPWRCSAGDVHAALELCKELQTERGMTLKDWDSTTLLELGKDFCMVWTRLFFFPEHCSCVDKPASFGVLLI